MKNWNEDEKSEWNFRKNKIRQYIKYKTVLLNGKFTNVYIYIYFQYYLNEYF